MDKSTHFIDLLAQSLKKERNLYGDSKKANTLLAALLEFRESALKNNKHSTAEHIDRVLASQGIHLREEKRIIITTE